MFESSISPSSVGVFGDGFHQLRRLLSFFELFETLFQVRCAVNVFVVQMFSCSCVHSFVSLLIK